MVIASIAFIASERISAMIPDDTSFAVKVFRRPFFVERSRSINPPFELPEAYSAAKVPVIRSRIEA